MKYKDYYKILDVDRKAAPEEIKRAYRKLAKKYHPDANPGTEADERFKDINEAYEVLGEETKRKKYDVLGRNFNFENGYDFDPSRFGFGNTGVRYGFKGKAGAFSDFFDMFFGKNAINLEDIFGGIASKSRKSRFAGGTPARGEDIESEMEVTIEEAFFGAEKRISLPSRSRRLKSYSVKVPSGIRSGEKIRLLGQGRSGINGGQGGDLFVRIVIRDHPKFRLEGSDMSVDIPLAPWEAALGCQVTVPSIDGALRVSIPAGIQSGERLRLAGRGYRSGGGGRGDLFAAVKIMVPRDITERERIIFEKLGEISEFNPREELV